jgi:senataxin
VTKVLQLPILKLTLGQSGLLYARQHQRSFVCTPSNAAVDELVMRLKQGVKTLRGEYHKLSIVRLGRSDAINTSVIDVTLTSWSAQNSTLQMGKDEPRRRNS